MIKRLPIPNLNGEDSQISQWCFDSHSWVEHNTGYFICEWCKKTYVGYTVIYDSSKPDEYFALCVENPALKRFDKGVLLNGD